MKRRNYLKSLITASALIFLPGVLKARSGHKTRSIMLADASIAGFQYYDGDTVWRRLKKGHTLQLVREPKNPYDYDAIEVYLGRDKLGYIPRRLNNAVAQLMDSGMKLITKINRVDRSRQEGAVVGITVEMVV